MTAPLAITVDTGPLVPHTMVTGDGDGPGASIPIDRSLAELIAEVPMTSEPGAQVKLRVQTGISSVGWVDLAEFPAITTPGSYKLYVTGVGDRLRVCWSVTDANGDPASATLKVTGTTHQLYCTPEDIVTYSLPAAALDEMPPQLLARACLAATDEAVSYLGAFFDLPIKSWGYALRMHTSNMAGYHALKMRGYNPDNDNTVRQSYLDAIEWLQRGAKNDPSIIDASPTTTSEAGYWVSEPPRGWQRS